jgi:hypothetical protein
MKIKHEIGEKTRTKNMNRIPSHSEALLYDCIGLRLRLLGRAQNPKQPQTESESRQPNPRSRFQQSKNQHQAFKANQARHILSKRHQRHRTGSESEIRGVLSPSHGKRNVNQRKRMRQGPPVFRRDAEALRRRKPWFSGEKRGFPVMGYEGRETNSGYMRERERERERGA